MILCTSLGIAYGLQKLNSTNHHFAVIKIVIGSTSSSSLFSCHPQTYHFLIGYHLHQQPDGLSPQIYLFIAHKLYHHLGATNLYI
jgi:hypothetical protein